MRTPIKQTLTLITFAALVGCDNTPGDNGIQAMTGDCSYIVNDSPHSSPNIEANRRLVVYSGLTGARIMELTGRMSVVSGNNTLEVTVNTGSQGSNQFTRHYIGLCDSAVWCLERRGD
jgi:hypothetical protein